MDYGGDGVREGDWLHTCQGDFPWGCSTTVDGGEEPEPDPAHDGTVDHRYTTEWSCPD